jgi:hypothetical protein
MLSIEAMLFEPDSRSYACTAWIWKLPAGESHEAVCPLSTHIFDHCSNG